MIIKSQVYVNKIIQNNFKHNKRQIDQMNKHSKTKFSQQSLSNTVKTLPPQQIKTKVNEHDNHKLSKIQQSLLGGKIQTGSQDENNEQDELEMLVEDSDDEDQEDFYEQQDVDDQGESQDNSQIQEASVISLNPIQKKKLQIFRKLQQQNITDPEQYQQIVQKLQSQNQTLKSDLQLLKQKVDLLKLKQMRKQKQKAIEQSNKKYLPEEQFKRLKKQLKKKYEQLQKLQKKSNKSSTKFQLQIQYRQFVNKLIELQNQGQEQKSYLKDEKKINKQLRKELKKYEGIKLTASKEAAEIQTFNKQLKNKIFIMKKIIANLEQSEIEVHKHQIQVKQREKKAAQLMRYQILRQKMEKKKLEKLEKKLRNDPLEGYDKNIDPKQVKQRLSAMKFAKLDSKVRARTEFSFEPKEDFPPIQKNQSALRQNRNRAMTQASEQNPFTHHQQSLQSLVPQIAATIPSLSRQQIHTLSNFLKNETLTFQKYSTQLQQRISFMQQHINANYRRSGSIFLLSKQKDMLCKKNRILLQQLNSLYNKKVQLLHEYNIVQKYYGDYDAKKQNGVNREKVNETPQSQKYIEAQKPVNQKGIQRQTRYIDQFNRSKSEMKFSKEKRPSRSKMLRNIVTSMGTHTCQNDSPVYDNGRNKSPRKIPVPKKEESQQYIVPIPDPQPQPKPQVSQSQTQTDLTRNMYLTSFLLKEIKPSTSSQKKDFIGSIPVTQSSFDDRIYRNIEQKMYINQLTIVYDQKGILLLKAKYKPAHGGNAKNVITNDDSQDNQLQTDIEYKFENKMINSEKDVQNGSIYRVVTQLSINDYIKQVKLFYDFEQNYVSKLQFISKYNVKYEYGNKQLMFPTALSPHLNLNSKFDQNPSKTRSRNKPKTQSKPSHNQKFYSFDIKQNQYPSFMFGNYKEVDGKIRLEGLGFLVLKEDK